MTTRSGLKNQRREFSSGILAVLVILALLPYVIVVAMRWDEPPAATDGDYAQYLLHAKALVEGRPYTDIGYIYSAQNLVGPRAQPPGWPIVLAPFVAVFGTHSPVFKLLVVLLVASFAVVAACYFLRRGEVVFGIAVAATVPLALTTDHATSSALSDPLFCLLVWLTLLLADQSGPISWRRGVALAGLTAAAISVRIAGVALIPALLLFALYREKGDRARVIVPVMALVVVGTVFAWRRLAMVPFLDRSLSMPALSTLVTAYRGAFGVGTLYPFASNRANDIYHLAVSIPLLFGAGVFLRERYRTALASFALAYVALLVFSPVAESRYAWPLLPLLTVGTCAGVMWILEKLRGSGVGGGLMARRAAVLGGAALLIGATVQLLLRPARYSLTDDPDTIALFQWLQATRDTTDLRVVFTNPRVLTLETNVPAMGIPFGTPDEVVAELIKKEITHVVIPRKHLTRRAEYLLAEVAAGRSGQFVPVFSNATHDVRKFVAHPSLSPGSGTTTMSYAR